jgi:hypothetical protein
MVNYGQFPSYLSSDMVQLGTRIQSTSFQHVTWMIHIKIILISRGLYQCNKILYALLVSHICSKFLIHLILIYWIALITFGVKYKFMKNAFMQNFSTYCYFLSFKGRYIPRLLMGLIGCPETSVTTNLRCVTTPKRKSHLHRGGSPKPIILLHLLAPSSQWSIVHFSSVINPFIVVCRHPPSKSLALYNRSTVTLPVTVSTTSCQFPPHQPQTFLSLLSL